MTLSDEDVREILRLIDESDVAELHLETENFTLHVRKGKRDDGAAWTSLKQDPQSSPSSRAAEVEPTAEHDDATVVPDDGAVTIDSPMLGTFYRAPEPGASPFVEVGSAVQPDTTVCIIEVMKMMNSIPAGVAGTIVEVLPEDAQVVEHGEPLFRVKAAA